jgi:hypothetical protein
MTIQDVCRQLNMRKWKIQKYLKKVCLGDALVVSNHMSLKLTTGLGYSGVLT